MSGAQKGKQGGKNLLKVILVIKSRPGMLCEACQRGDVIRKHTWVRQRMHKSCESTEGNAICK